MKVIHFVFAIVRVCVWAGSAISAQLYVNDMSLNVCYGLDTMELPAVSKEKLFEKRWKK